MKITERPLFGRFLKDGKRYAIRYEDGDTQMPRKYALENGYEIIDSSTLKLELVKRQKKSEIAAARYKEEFGGFSDNDSGIFIRTDERTRNLITMAYASAINDSSYIIENWKLNDGSYTSLDAQTLIYIMGKIQDFITSAFNKEKSLNDSIDAATSINDVENISW